MFSSRVEQHRWRLQVWTIVARGMLLYLHLQAQAVAVAVAVAFIHEMSMGSDAQSADCLRGSAFVNKATHYKNTIVPPTTTHPDDGQLTSRPDQVLKSKGCGNVAFDARQFQDHISRINHI